MINWWLPAARAVKNFTLSYPPRAPTVLNLSHTGASLTSVHAIPYEETEPTTLEHSPEASHKRRQLQNRPGIIARKRGMMPFFDKATGLRVACTVLEVDRVEVTHVKTKEKDGYFAVQVGCGFRHPEKLTRPLLGHFAAHGVSPKERVTEFQVRDESCLVPVGTELKADHFKPGQFVDLTGVSRGKGFQGVMKRWNFGGLRASHGTSLTHRSGGSYGMNQTPGRVLPGKKMPGHMGARKTTIQSCEILDVDGEKGIILVKGPVPGARDSYVRVQDAVKKYCKAAV